MNMDGSCWYPWSLWRGYFLDMTRPWRPLGYNIIPETFANLDRFLRGEWPHSAAHDALADAGAFEEEK
jgi:hypothetical protein